LDYHTNIPEQREDFWEGSPSAERLKNTGLNSLTWQNLPKMIPSQLR